MQSSSKKAYYSISEVAKATGLEQHVIRYWESEFPKLKPRKNRAGNRQFREKDITIIKYIKHLLHNEMYTIQGARKKLADAGYKEVEGQLDLLNIFAPVVPVVTQTVNIVPEAAVAPVANPSLGRSTHQKDFLKSLVRDLKSIQAILKS